MTAIRQLHPKPQPCHACGVEYAGIACPHCKEERPAFNAMKNISAQPPAPLQPCRYYPGEACGCGQRGACLPAA